MHALRCGRVPGLVLGLALGMATVASAGTRVLDVLVVDEQGESLPCRVLVRPDGADCVVPTGAVPLRIGPDCWFMSPGRCEVEVPGGPVQLRVERGLEFTRYKERLQLTDVRTKVTVRLQRWVDMKRRGYLGGENHVHVDTQQLAAMLAAEGLDFGSSLTWWNGPDDRRPIPPGDGHLRALTYAGWEAPSSVFDAELEHAWGAAYLQNLPAAMPLESERGRPNLDYLKHACQSGGIVHYQGGWSREVAVDALLGYVHTINICNNNFHLHRFQPRSRYSNLLEVSGFPTYPDTDSGMMQMNTDTYYRLLNWGLRLAAGAGSAVGVKEVPVGYNRAYVRAPRAASLGDFNRAWAAGKNFVSNGPILLLQTDRGDKPGAEIKFSADGGDVGLELTALSNQVLTSVELIVNGQTAARWKPANGHEFHEETQVRIRHGAWIAARCAARDDWLSDDELEAYASSPRDHPFRQAPSRLRFAHTSPIYVSVAGRGAAVDDSIAEGLRMLDRFEQFARQEASPKYRRAIVDATAAARQRLRQRLGNGSPR